MQPVLNTVAIVICFALCRYPLVQAKKKIDIRCAPTLASLTAESQRVVSSQVKWTPTGMPNRICFSIALLIGVALVGCKEDSTALSSSSVSVCYIPFSAHTFAPVTRANIGTKCTDLGMLNIHDEPIRGLYQEINRSSGASSFDDNVVRLSIRGRDGSLLYVDQNGNVTRNGRMVKLSADFVEKLDRKLYKLQQTVFDRRSVSQGLDSRP